MNNELTQKEVRRILYYDKTTGIFTWKVNPGKGNYRRKKAGDIAGYRANSGYVMIGINGKHYKASRLAFLYVKGYFPENKVDHKDQVKHHDWWDNLREVSTTCNARNTGNRSTSKSGVKGVSFHKATGKWYANIMVNGKTRNLGYHSSIMEAACHRLAAEQCVDWAGCDSNSPAYQYVILGKRRTLK